MAGVYLPLVGTASEENARRFWSRELTEVAFSWKKRRAFHLTSARPFLADRFRNTIVDTPAITGKINYVIRAVGIQRFD
jgi:hypothetical protein